MLKLASALIASAALLFGLNGCTATGAVAGGVAGHELSHGSTAGTIGGAVAGGVIGHELGK
ncbi:glycine zipper 2TM domain-containing protein [Cupriavidus sp. UME77]|uniref:glycine zipper 2TM domain-containing protein n=1 Tax=Cupriavidus sp. UME77 TaxID=1862321 RepID=UPI00160422FD|nr:glycine zipper 2TM domain-containing protein [Cupriavidus sp. UME77]MBB1633350.1 3-hydroxyisobutyrate dehydrogenase [Cupriavidus sp. UME77]